MRKQDVKETIELVVLSAVILYGVRECNHKVMNYNYNNAVEYEKKHSEVPRITETYKR